MLQKSFWCPKSSHKEHLFRHHDFFFNAYKSVTNANLKEQGLSLDRDREKP